jgi:glycosyltransferase involved in cell wall biosynthesis
MHKKSSRIIFITAQAPWSKGEAFIVEELLAFDRLGADFLIFPRNPVKKMFHGEAEGLVNRGFSFPIIDIPIVASFFAKIFYPGLRRAFFSIVKNSRSPQILLKNLAVFPKAAFIAGYARKNHIGHIHCHWGGTTATMGYIASIISGIPWSMTLHRWDIKENNILKLKVESARFVRCISEHGKKELSEIVGDEFATKIKVIHMGAVMPPKLEVAKISKNQIFTIVVPANLIEVKGHRYLIEALSRMKSSGRNFICHFYGDGDLRAALINDIKNRELPDYIKMPGALPHNQLVSLYRRGKVNCVILPSINTDSGEHEGIPVSLMEAMANEIPVISTNTGGIPELLVNGAGIIVPEKSVDALAQALQNLMDNPIIAQKIARVGHQKIESDFDIEKNTLELLRLIQKQ